MDVDPPSGQVDPTVMPSTSTSTQQMDQCPTEPADNQENFLQTGRVGRRNASKNSTLFPSLFLFFLHTFSSLSLYPHYPTCSALHCWACSSPLLLQMFCLSCFPHLFPPSAGRLMLLSLFSSSCSSFSLYFFSPLSPPPSQQLSPSFLVPHICALSSPLSIHVSLLFTLFLWARLQPTRNCTAASAFVLSLQPAQMYPCFFIACYSFKSTCNLFLYSLFHGLISKKYFYPPACSFICSSRKYSLTLSLSSFCFSSSLSLASPVCFAHLATCSQFPT